MTKRLPYRLHALALAGFVAACSPDTPNAGQSQPRDPLIEQTLREQLMIDPDLVSLNEGNAALTISFGGGVPTLDASPEARNAAMAKAGELIGGRSAMLRLAGLETYTGTPTMEPGPILLERALESDIGEACLAKLDYSAIWAARMPAQIVIYPHAALRDAAGYDGADCTVRLASYATPVSADEVASFYYTLARKGGFAMDIAVGNELRLTAARKAERYTVHIRERGDGITLVDIVATGAPA